MYDLWGGTCSQWNRRAWRLLRRRSNVNTWPTSHNTTSTKPCLHWRLPWRCPSSLSCRVVSCCFVSSATSPPHNWHVLFFHALTFSISASLFLFCVFYSHALQHFTGCIFLLHFYTRVFFCILQLHFFLLLFCDANRRWRRRARR